jgi:hypothetical protein
MEWLPVLTVALLAVVVYFGREAVAALRRVEALLSAQQVEEPVPFPAAALAAQRESMKRAQAKAQALGQAFTERWCGPKNKRKTPEEDAECLRAERESTYEYQIALVEERDYCEMLRANARVRLGQELLFEAHSRVTQESHDRRYAEILRSAEAEKAGCFLSEILQRDEKAEGTPA